MLSPIEKISVILCTYNSGSYLQSQLDSICNQTYSNLEIIISDDASSDQSIHLLKEYQKRDSRITVYQNEKNLGFVQNFSKAIALATGAYIALADQDDIWELYKLETFVNEIKNHTLIYSDAQRIDAHGNNLGYQLVRPQRNLVSGHCSLAFLLSNCVSGNTLMFRRELLQYILPIPDIQFHDVWIAFVASSIGEIAYTSEPMTYYREHGKQVTNVTKGFRYVVSTFARKKQKWQKQTSDNVRLLNAFLEFSLKTNNEKNMRLLKELIRHYQNYNRIFINHTLREMLIKNADAIFASAPKHKRLQYAKRASVGLVYHRLFLYLK